VIILLLKAAGLLVLQLFYFCQKCGDNKMPSLYKNCLEIINDFIVSRQRLHDPSVNPRVKREINELYKLKIDILCAQRTPERLVLADKILDMAIHAKNIMLKNMLVDLLQVFERFIDDSRKQEFIKLLFAGVRRQEELIDGRHVTQPLTQATFP
jgi:hypothetical protein